MRKLVLVSLLLLSVFTFMMLAPNARAEDNPWVATYDVYDNPQTQFDPGETVRIKAYSHLTPYYIYIHKPDASLKKTIGPINTPSYSDDHDDITTDEGWWTLFILEGETQHFGVGQYFVIPEVPLGVVTALTACFAGLGVRRLRRTKKETL